MANLNFKHVSFFGKVVYLELELGHAGRYSATRFFRFSNQINLSGEETKRYARTKKLDLSSKTIVKYGQVD